jgi:hypothetical protein
LRVLAECWANYWRSEAEAAGKGKGRGEARAGWKRAGKGWRRALLALAAVAIAGKAD